MLKIITKTKIPQHLKKGMVACGISHIFKIVMLTSRANTTLRGNRFIVWTFLYAQKNILELHHPGVGKQQSRIVPRNQGTTRHDFMIPVAEIIQEGVSDVGTAFHDLIIFRLRLF